MYPGFSSHVRLYKELTSEIGAEVFQPLMKMGPHSNKLWVLIVVLNSLWIVTDGIKFSHPEKKGI